MPTHSETRDLPYSAQQMYDLVADVARYPEFLPWTAAARIRETREEGAQIVLLADLVISFKVFRERFGSRVTLTPEAHRIDTEYLDGPFRKMVSNWVFEDAGPGACKVQFHVDFEFRNKLLQTTASVFFNEAMQRVVRAFETRARDLYGPPTE
ncbi:MAG: type II toxin-antitoxin system RatA family toxin [Silicimonas sp.]|nr:type II toxin-antitoxin system RatA family toxin [Silicimonas sp.]